ncbi:hypothetical protein [Actinoplanes sp. NPDC051859]|uniref:hypothetical protein n=1 Tax=Actinoplanes sp. NPDC051859 TaxID=3363909 RepID=UPI0037960DA5
MGEWEVAVGEHRHERSKGGLRDRTVVSDQVGGQRPAGDKQLALGRQLRPGF